MSTSRSDSGTQWAFTTDWAIDPSSWSPPGYRLPAISHDGLLELAQRTVEAAHNHEPDLVEVDTLRLFEALSEHMLAERPVLRQLPAGDAHLLRHGQHQLENRLLELAASATQKADSCECESLADDLLAELTRQADEEGRQLLAHGDRVIPIAEWRPTRPREEANS